jgi:hypothetical protein
MTLTVDTVLDHVTTVRVLLRSGEGRDAYNACGALLNAAVGVGPEVRDAALDYTLIVGAVASGACDRLRDLNRAELALIGYVKLRALGSRA